MCWKYARKRRTDARRTVKRSIAVRLVIVTVLGALAIFAAIGIALTAVVERELDKHLSEQLNTKFGAAEILIFRSRNIANWERVSATLDAWSSPAEGTRFWVWSEDERFRYGPQEHQRFDVVRASSGVAEVMMDDIAYPIQVRVADIQQNGARSPVRLMVGIDPTLFMHTKRSVEGAIAALALVGVLLVSALGYVTVRAGLAPLRRVSQEAQTLSPRNLAQRLEASALPLELSNLVGSFNGALDRVERAYQQLEAFNADVAHELRTPLANLIGQTQVALSRQRTARQFEDVLQSNLEELERLRTIISNMLFLTRADQGERAVDLASASIAQEALRTVEFLDFIMDEAGVRVRVQGDARACVDSSLFRRAVTNLLHNAIRHSPRGSEVVVDISSAADLARIAIHNPGPQIPAQHLPRLFDRFYRIDSVRANSGESHGLGLSIVKAIALMHRGGVFASSKDGVTTVGFTVARGAAGEPTPQLRIA